MFDYNQYSPPIELETEPPLRKNSKNSISNENEIGNQADPSEIQYLLGTAESLLKTNKIKEALRIYEYSIYI